MKNILTEALVNSATNASFIFSYTNSAKLRIYFERINATCSYNRHYCCQYKLYRVSVNEMKKEIKYK